MLTNHQIIALVLGILLPITLLLISAYTCGINKGKLLIEAVEFNNGYQAGLCKQSEYIGALQEDIGTLNQRIKVLSTALDSLQSEHKATHADLAAAQDELQKQRALADALAGELRDWSSLLLTEQDLQAINRAGTLLQREAKRFAKTGSSKINHAAQSHAALTRILQAYAPESRVAA